MTTHAHAEDPDLVNSYPALLRAAQRARETAKRFGTPLVVWQDGKVVLIPPDQIDLATTPMTDLPR